MNSNRFYLARLASAPAVSLARETETIQEIVDGFDSVQELRDLASEAGIPLGKIYRVTVEEVDADD